ncbi:branched-chain amino acid ABC transporter substrate-binding protein [Actinomycetospora straminea]|uniref:Branched-chain amino acid ABC transporter substrate-binding protein n=1 Tax=Actinomycetospora straminea TaxID=663607 RepID=A0ABP9DUW5_9PSEU|nr:branched-chain amino acid ABC transporter substrate-binding protein [Actinomycetospora straminea]MDD7932420.1 branched-chain amino acid ABC transporter substrate-binding protein [Actinomycetospora straminea]
MGARRRRRFGTVAALAVAVVLLAGCGGVSGSSGDGSDCDTSRGTLVVGLVAPLSGELASVGLGMKNSADLAVSQANARCAVPGYHLAVQSQDDRADPATGAAAARTLAQDPSLLGVLGPFNSSVAQAIQPVLSDAGIVQISPGSTATSLTRGANAVTAPLRQYQTFFRTVATDAVQGPAAATYLTRVEDRRRIAVVSDGKTYGEGIAEEFAKQLATEGGQVAVRVTAPPGSARDGVVARVAAARPDAVFYGGEYPEGGPLSAALAARGVTVPVMGGDGIVNPGFVTSGGREGDLGTSVGPPPETLPAAQGFVDAYRRAGYPESIGSYGAFTFDAANVLVDSAVRTLGDDREWSPAVRPEMVRAVQGFHGDGVTGPLSFDRFGDVSRDAVTVYRVQAGGWSVVGPVD